MLVFGLVRPAGTGHVLEFFFDMDLYIDLDAPFKSPTFFSPSLADSAAPAACCWLLDFAGMVISPCRNESLHYLPALHKDANIAGCIL